MILVMIRSMMPTMRQATYDKDIFTLAIGLTQSFILTLCKKIGVELLGSEKDLASSWASDRVCREAAESTRKLATI